MDREKVIKAIETHISTDDSVGCDDCTYENDGWCTTRVLSDALALVKEQESTLNRLRSTMEDMVRGNASEEVLYLLRLLDKWE